MGQNVARKGIAVPMNNDEPADTRTASTQARDAEIDSFNDWLRAALARCKTQEEREAVNGESFRDAGTPGASVSALCKNTTYRCLVCSVWFCSSCYKHCPHCWAPHGDGQR